MIKVKNLWKSYRKDEWVIKDISFEVKEGEVVALLGHNGAGKTTTFKCILNLIFPQRGEIEICGISNKDEKVKDFIGYLPENQIIPEYYKVKEILKIGLILRNYDKSEIEKRVEEVLEILELKDFENKEISKLSKGNRQKVQVGYSIIHSPKIYLWDEPSSNLDPIARMRLLDFIKGEKEKGKAFLISSHILTEIEKVCSRVIIIKKGEIVLDKDTDDILKEWKTIEEVYLECHK